MPSYQKQSIPKLILLIASVCFTLVLAEFVLRLIYPANPKYYVWQPNLHYNLYPDSTIFYGVHGEKHFDINEDGNRGERFSNSTQNYICIGGSTTECLYLDNRETWMAQLQRKLNEQAGKKFVIGSIGKSGVTTRENYIQLKYCIPSLKNVTGVIMMVGMNDLMKRLSKDSLFENNFQFTLYIEDSLKTAILLADSRSKETHWYRRTALFSLLQNAYHNFFPVQEIEPVEDPEGKIYATWREHRRRAAAILDSLPDLSIALDEFERNLQLMYEEAQRQHLKLILINQAAIYSDSMNDYERSLLWMGGIGKFQLEAGHVYYSTSALSKGLSLYNERLASFCKKKNIQCIDIASYLPRDTSIFYDDCHFNENGAKVLGNYVSGFFPSSH